MELPGATKAVLLALLDDRADPLDKAADELGDFFDHPRQVGIRGLVAEKRGDSDDGIPGQSRHLPTADVNRRASAP